MVLFLYATQPVAFGQNECDKHLNKAMSFYENAQFDSVINLLKYSLKNCWHKKRTKLNIYKYLAGAYYEIDNMELSKYHLHKLLQRRPYYKINSSTDPSAFIAHINKTTILPVLNLGIRHLFFVPLDIMKIKVLKEYKTANIYSFYPIPDYQGQVSIDFELHINKNLSVYSPVALIYNNFNPGPRTQIQGNVDTTYYTNNFTEKRTILQLPILIKTTMCKNQVGFSPYVGFYYSYLIRDKIDISQLKVNTGTNPYGKMAGWSFFNIGDIRNIRNNYNLGWIAGMNLSWSKNSWKIYLDYRYGSDYLNMVDEENRYAHAELYNDYGYLDSDIKLSYHSITLGYSRTIIYKFKDKFNQ
ncbi:MAG: hypothetical protein COC01_07705 [Bacteroidetes bacterium]|nr:MAG: hypothetical protein COC01_07705 [Bacteroidota bacterium]